MPTAWFPIIAGISMGLLASAALTVALVLTTALPMLGGLLLLLVLNVVVLSAGYVAVRRFLGPSQGPAAR